jgi:TRAP-type C4-dicarboxylate transport system permease small subunit
MRSVLKVIDNFNKGLEVLVGLVLVLMTALIFLQVLVRLVFAKLNIQFSVPWTEELARYLMIWAIFIGAALVARRADALAVEALVQAVPAPVARAIKYAAHFLSLAFYVFIFVLGLDWAKFGMSETAPVLGVDMVWVYSSLSVGAALTIVNALALLIEIRINRTDILDVVDHEVDDVVHEVEMSLQGQKV